MPPKPATLEAMDHVVVWVRDPAKAEEFYVSLLGMKVAGRIPEVGWLAVHPRGGGTRLALLVPDPGTPGYEEAKANLGGHTGIGLVTGDLKGTLEQLKARGVAIPWASLDPASPGGIHATIEDQDGNLLMLFQPGAKARGKAGLDRVDFVNVVVRNLRAAKDFYHTSLGLKPGEELDTMAWVAFHCADKASAAVGVFEPVEETYEDPDAYAADIAHVGEATGVAFRTRDLEGCLAELRARGVTMTSPPERGPEGGRRAEIADPDGNTFTVLEARAPAAPRKGAARKAKAKPKPKARAKAPRAKPKAKPAPKRAAAKKKPAKANAKARRR